jgi:hypothetical protein
MWVRLPPLPATYPMLARVPQLVVQPHHRTGDTSPSTVLCPTLWLTPSARPRVSNPRHTCPRIVFSLVHPAICFATPVPPPPPPRVHSRGPISRPPPLLQTGGSHADTAASPPQLTRCATSALARSPPHGCCLLAPQVNGLGSSAAAAPAAASLSSRGLTRGEPRDERPLTPSPTSHPSPR